MVEKPGGNMRQELGQRQGLLLTPALKQSLHLLTMPLLELAAYAAAQVEENPVLELGPEDTAASAANNGQQEPAFAAAANKVETAGFDEEAWQQYTQTERDYGPDYTNTVAVPEQDYFRPDLAASEEQGLYSLLRLQLATKDAEPGLRQAALLIIEHLDEDGYLSLPLPHLAQLTGCSQNVLEEALHLVQTLDPPGIAARDVRECLGLQIGGAEPQRELILAIIEQYLPQVARNKSREIARALKTTIDQVELAFARIRELHPRPAAALAGSAPATPYIVPDIIIREIDGIFVAALNEGLEPRLHISSYYRRLAPQLQANDKEARAYLRQKFSAAQALISQMEKRRQTLLNLAQITADKQADFLRHGVARLAPLTMKEVAEQAGLHESTVSRAVAGKYCQTPRGVYEWKFFFPRAYETSVGVITPALAKQQLAALIAREDKKHPYSDQNLADLLAAEGLHIARRTVAKYREELRLPPRYLRRKP